MQIQSIKMVGLCIQKKLWLDIRSTTYEHLTDTNTSHKPPALLHTLLVAELVNKTKLRNGGEKYFSLPFPPHHQNMMTYYDEDFIRQDLKARFKRISQLSRFRYSYSKWEQLEIYIRHLEVMYDITHNFLWNDVQSLNFIENFPDHMPKDFFRKLEELLFSAIKKTINNQIQYIIRYEELRERREKDKF